MRRVQPSSLFMLLLPAGLVTAGCDGHEEAPPTATAERLPGEVCDKARKTLAELEGAGVLTLNTPTDGVVEQRAWVPMRANGQTAVLSAIGLAATCSGEPQLEQEVTIHSPDGEVLARRAVKTSYSTADALAF
jgi:hypothetical protein